VVFVANSLDKLPFKSDDLAIRLGLGPCHRQLCLAKSAHKFARALEKRDALNKWTAHLKVARAQASGANVTAIRKS
jgi:hypothetical protein